MINGLILGVVLWAVYRIYRVLAGNIGLRILSGLGSIAVWCQLAIYLGIPIVDKIVKPFIDRGIVLLLILFQPEIRQVLSRVGTDLAQHSNRILRFIHLRRVTGFTPYHITAIVEAAKILGGTNTGALIVFTRGTDMRHYERLGDPLDALVSKRLLLTIFNKKSPLHDGGIIIRKGRVTTARCIFPVTAKQHLPAYYGLRHRAAIGLTEQTDALVLIVSEETGQLAIAHNGAIDYGLSTQAVRVRINKYLRQPKVTLKATISA